MTREAEFVICEQSIHHYFRLWRLDGTWERINAVCYAKRLAYVLVAILNRAPGSWIPNP